MTEQRLGGHDQDPQAEYRARVAEHSRVLGELAAPGASNRILAIVAAVKVEQDPLLAASLAKDFSMEELPSEADRSADLVFSAILKKPERGERLSPRWMLVEELNQKVGDTVKRHAEGLLVAAGRVGMRREADAEDYSRIDPDAAEFVVEGGANKTSIVRRGVAEKAMQEVFGPNLAQRTLYQFGGDRVISQLRADGSENPEHKTVRGLAGDHLQLRPDGSFEEFDANLATALADGYIITEDRKLRPAGIARLVTLVHVGSERPRLVQVKPVGKGLPGGFDSLQAIKQAEGGTLEGRQLVIATNGQYRPKDELQAATWAAERGLAMVPAVGLGDEPGDTWLYKGETMETPARPAAAYVNELALYGAQTAAYLSR